jgi:hypothetical protein
MVIVKTKPKGIIRGLDLEDGYAYVAAGRAGLRVIDLSSPSEPVEVGSHLPPFRSLHVDDCRGLFYVDQTPDGVEIVQDCEAVAIDDTDRHPPTPHERNPS